MNRLTLSKMNLHIAHQLIRLAIGIVMVTLFTFSVLPFTLLNVMTFAALYGVMEMVMVSYSKTTSLPRGISGTVVKYTANDKPTLTRNVA